MLCTLSSFGELSRLFPQNELELTVTWKNSLMLMLVGIFVLYVTFVGKSWRSRFLIKVQFPAGATLFEVIMLGSGMAFRSLATSQVSCVQCMY